MGVANLKKWPRENGQDQAKTGGLGNRHLRTSAAVSRHENPQKIMVLLLFILCY